MVAVRFDYNLPSTSLIQRSSSASAAFLIVLAALSVFQVSQHRKAHHNTSQHQSQLIWLQAPAPIVAALPPQKQNKARAAISITKKNQPTATTTASIQANPTAPEVPLQAESKNDFDDAFKSQANLDHTLANKGAGIDRTSIRRAYQDSKTELQKQAEKSGVQLADTRLTQQEKFQQAANRAAKPDCLRQGGSILSLFVVAYQVATDHCK